MKTKNKKYVLLPLILLGILFVHIPLSFAADPCASNAPSNYIDPKAYCDPTLYPNSVSFVISGTATPDTTSHETGFGAIVGLLPPKDPSTTGSTTATTNVICCCKSDGASIDEINAQLHQPVETGETIRLKSCPQSCKAAKVFTVNGLNRSNFTPQPCGTNLTIDPQYSPLNTLSGFIGKWYAAFFYLAVVLAIIQIFRGGFEYAIAAGNSSKTEEAKGIIVEAVIGLAVALLAAGILVFLRGTGVFLFQ